MRKLLILFLLLCFVFLLSGCIFQEKLSPDLQTMIKFAKKNNLDKSIQFFDNFSASEYKEFEKYLDNHPEDLSPIYFILMADKVFKYDKEKAIFYYFFGILRVTEDVLMCKDESNREQLVMFPMLAEKTLQYYATLEDIEFDINMLQKTLDWDDKYSRVSPIWVCGHGIQQFIDGRPPELLPASEFPKKRAVVREMVEKSIKARKDNPNFYSEEHSDK